MTKTSNSQKGLAGEIAVLSQLSLRGYDANLTLGYAKSVDILASNPTSGSLYRIEVKTTFTNKTKGGEWGESFHWQMHKKHEKLDDPRLFFVFVHLNEDGKNGRFFVVPSKVVGEYCYQSHQHWLTKDPSHQDSDVRVFRIGLEEDGHYEPPIPQASVFEDAWPQ